MQYYLYVLCQSKCNYASQTGWPAIFSITASKTGLTIVSLELNYLDVFMCIISELKHLSFVSKLNMLKSHMFCKICALQRMLLKLQLRSSDKCLRSMSCFRSKDFNLFFCRMQLFIMKSCVKLQGFELLVETNESPMSQTLYTCYI